MDSLITHEGEVMKASDGIVYVRISQQAACSGCHASSACPVSESREKIIEVADKNESYREGDKVLLVSSSKQGLGAVLLAYVIPLLLIFVSLFSLLAVLNHEAIAIVISMGVVAVYYYVLYLFRDKLKGKFSFEIKNP